MLGFFLKRDRSNKMRVFTSEPVGRSESTDHIRPYNDLEIVALEAR